MASNSRSTGYALRMILLGEAGAGKSSLFYRIKHKGFREDVVEDGDVDTVTGSMPRTSRNFQYDTYTRTVHISPKIKVTLTLVDTGGRERVQSLTSQYYRRAHIILLVCSLDSEYTLNRLTKWYGEAKYYVDDTDVTYAVVGTKSDLLDHEREVTLDMLQGFAMHYSISESSVFEVSARTGSGVKEMLTELCRISLEKYNAVEGAAEGVAIPEPLHMSSSERSSLLRDSFGGDDVGNLQLVHTTGSGLCRCCRGRCVVQ